jgi:hypothetical protein
MPMLEVGFIAMDPMVASPFEVLRRAETVDAKGRASIPEVSLGKKWGSVMVIDPAKLDRGEDGAMVPRNISVISRNQLVPLSQGFQPDIVVWRGTRYTVTECTPHPQFGRGFYQAKCESMNATDKAL